MKRLVVIPVVHDLADLGSLAESVRARYLAEFGAAGWERRQRAVESLWKTIRRAIDAMPLDFARVRIYQDGLPLCGKEELIVRELAGAGSLNHQLVLELMGRGAAIVGTEDPHLLLREYQFQRRQAVAESDAGPPLAPSPARAADEAAGLLEARDRFIAQRIEATLEEGETGLLFLGAAHRLGTMQSSGIDVTTLDLRV